MTEYSIRTGNKIGGSDTDDFATFIQNRIYVDKSLFIKEIIESTNHVFISAPQRWGKSLNLSMLIYFFQPDGDDSEHYNDEGKYDFSKGN